MMARFAGIVATAELRLPRSVEMRYEFALEAKASTLVLSNYSVAV
jgi:hypothetical protein